MNNMALALVAILALVVGCTCAPNERPLAANPESSPAATTARPLAPSAAPPATHSAAPLATTSAAPAVGGAHITTAISPCSPPAASPHEAPMST